MKLKLSRKQAKNLFIQAQGLNDPEPFGKGPGATVRAIQHLGYVQIDTINVIERCHHHILFTRIPSYRRMDLRIAQSRDKSVFEYWTHALAYVPTTDFKYFLPRMKAYAKDPRAWFRSVPQKDTRAMLTRIRKEGPLSIRDIEDEVLKEKDHPWESRKPSKKVLQHAFYCGKLTVSERQGMLKKYELMDRHFDWEHPPKTPSLKECLDYLIDRALRSQAIVSLDSICYLRPKLKADILKRLEWKVRRQEIRPIEIQDLEGKAHWISTSLLDQKEPEPSELLHLLSPFDPLVIQRKRLPELFDHDHRFEAYLPKEKRRFGYFALPILAGDEIVALIDLKTDRERAKVLIQQMTWLPRKRTPALKRKLEAELDRFAKFQLAREPGPLSNKFSFIK